ncbi:phenylacetate--CoA ligase family protein [Adhaeretor mobilis]|uniref:Phenylacetate-coenzyme A ligase n=1 Tax=Adhaeretor mobilis TaxID=1930276 RepID=A0A517MQ05_9BACT|nr:phenylacetate--CoA ligase family protein [Adhaeretor mobilis]QDS96961.1 Phenylacetate-coenzyme A ligase [Adhaeretor mobilis]
MNKKLKAIYYSLPPRLQDLAISAHGYRLKSQRFGSVWRRKVDELMSSQWWNAESHREYQLSKLRQLVKEAVDWTTYYRETLGDSKISPSSFQRIEDIRKLPILDKSVLRSRTKDFYNLAPWRKPVEIELTSGSTGTPLAIPVDQESISTAVALLERQYRWAGVSFMQRHARLAGAIISKNDDPIRPYRFNYAWNQLLCSSYHLTPPNIRKIAQALGAFRPKYLHCYPSAGYSVAKWLNKNPRFKSKIGLQAVFTTAETLYDFQRQEMENAYGCTVWNHYGSAEGAPFIGQCDQGRLHVNDESGIVEFLRPDGTPASAGEEAEMVVTSFRSFGVPLIRYRIGDYAIWSDEECPCGREMTVVSEIRGRHDDVMVTSERGVVGRLSQVSKVAPQAFIESQIEELQLDYFIFRYVPDPNYFLAERDLPAIAGEMRERLGSGIHIDFKKLDQIECGARGKFRSMIGLPRELWPRDYQ